MERTVLRATFGGIDVPILPDDGTVYAIRDLPEHLTWSRLRAMDSSSRKHPLSDRRAALGRVLFYDKQMSVNDSISCASCHEQKRAFSDARVFSVGFAGKKTGRNAMGLGYLRFSIVNGARPGFFWDERAPTLEDQVLMPIQDEVEMGMSLDALNRKLQALPYYPPLFEGAFGTPEVTAERIAVATAQFMQSMATFDSKFDLAAGDAQSYSDDFDGFTQEENLGKSLFIDGVGNVGEIGCAHCHVPPMFGMPKAFNNGLERGYSDQGLGSRPLPSNDPFTPNNNGKFKAPPLRNIALTAPYMHDGRFKTLEQVVEHYSSGVHPHENLGLAFNDIPEATNEPRATSGFQLTPAQKSAIVAFLKTLTDNGLVSESRFSDPFVRSKE